MQAVLQFARQQSYSQKGRKAFSNQAIQLEPLLLPVMFHNQERPFTLPLQVSQPLAERPVPALQAFVPASAPRYGFFGRDLDTLQIEKHLLTARNILLVKGMCGVGKTALVQHLGSWWQMTGLCERVFFFSYD